VKTALVTNECQVGSIGEEALWQALRDAARPMIPSLVRLASAARRAGAPVAHLVAVRRPDLRGANRNAPLFEFANRSGGLQRGASSSRLIPELGPEPSDLVLEKTHGVASLRSTGLDAALRNLDVDQIMLTGVSLNVAIPALAFEAVNLGYHVVIPRDAVAGVPPSYAEDVLRHTLALVADVVTADNLIDAWARAESAENLSTRPDL
jgi:nicotinamidase-related amidase